MYSILTFAQQVALEIILPLILFIPTKTRGVHQNKTLDKTEF